MHLKIKLLLTALGSLAIARALPGAEAMVYKRIGGRELKLFVEKPADWKSTDLRPAILFFFGGGWVGGKAEQFLPQSEYFATRGVVGIRAEYRVIPKGDLGPPTVCCQDAKSAMRYVRAHAAELGIDPERIAAAGGSAGGHLAAVTALVPGLDDPVDDLAVSCRPQALILFNPVFNNGPGQWGYKRVGERYRDFSPAHHIAPGAPPTIVFLGDADKLIPVSVVTGFAGEMKKIGARCDSHLYPGVGHGFFNQDPYRTLTLIEADRFLASLGWIKGPPTLRTPAADFTVAPRGADSNPGTPEMPFATLERARDAVRQLKGKTHQRDIVVQIRGGVYRLTQTVAFGLQDSGEDGGSIRYEAAPGEEPIFTSGVLIGGWERPLQDPPGLPEQARGKVWVAHVPAALRTNRHFYTLYEDGGRLPRARMAGFAPLDDGDDFTLNRSTLRFPPGALRNWSNLDDVEIFIRPYWNWVVNMLPLASVDEIHGVATTATPGTYSLGPVHHERDASRSCWVENVMEGMLQPGNWVLNSRVGRITLWPKQGSPQAVSAPLLRQLILVQGDPNGDEVVRNLVFQGLTFTQGECYRWGGTDAGVQHDWEMYDSDDALVRLRGAEDCAVEDCRFADSGGTAVRLDLRCQHDSVRENLIERMGSAGIVLCGYGPGRLDLNQRNEISDNLIRFCGEIYWHAAGILLFQSGENHVANNHLSHLPYTGIVLTGATADHFKRADNREISRTIRWAEVGTPGQYTDEQVRPFIHTRKNLVERNEIDHVMERLGDGNAIYIRMSGEGNVIRRNYVHDLVSGNPQTAIRTDGGQEGTLIAENVITRCVGGGITQKLNNRVENNLICDLLGTNDPRNPTRNPQRGFVLLREGPIDGAAFKHNVFYQPAGVGAVPFYAASGGVKNGGARAHLKDAEVDDNLYYCAGAAESGAAFLAQSRAQGCDQNSCAADPGFVDAVHDDFRLKPGSPLLKSGFTPIDVGAMGLTKRFPERWRREPSR